MKFASDSNMNGHEEHAQTHCNALYVGSVVYVGSGVCHKQFKNVLKDICSMFLIKHINMK